MDNQYRAKERVKKIFDIKDKVYVAFSGGKDSTVSAYLVLEEYKRRLEVGDSVWNKENKPVLLVMDAEFVLTDTEKFISDFYENYKEYFDLYWFCIPIKWQSGVNFEDGNLVSWDKSLEDVWIQPLPKYAITEDTIGSLGISEYYPGMDEKDFQYAFAKWFGKKYSNAGCITGIRKDESLDRRIILESGDESTGYYSHKGRTDNYSVIQDWSTEEVFNFLKEKLYNKFYDKMYEFGIPLSKQRIASLLNFNAIKDLKTIRSLDFETYNKMVNRYPEIQFMEEFSKQGYYNFSKPNKRIYNGYNYYKYGERYIENEISKRRYEKAKEHKGDLTIRYSWKDYFFYMANNYEYHETTEKVFKKFRSVEHKLRFRGRKYHYDDLLSLIMLSQLPDWFVYDTTLDTVDGWFIERFNENNWPIIRVNHLPDDSFVEMAKKCFNRINDEYSKYGYLINNSTILKYLIYINNNYYIKNLYLDNLQEFDFKNKYSIFRNLKLASNRVNSSSSVIIIDEKEGKNFMNDFVNFINSMKTRHKNNVSYHSLSIMLLINDFNFKFIGRN